MKLVDVLMANPPFAGDIKQSDMLSSYELAHKRAKDGGQGKLESAVGRDLLFIERNLDFLRPGGRMAVVLPQGRFNSSSDERVRRFIAERCRILAVVGLHPNTFKPHTGTKTSVLFVQKWTEDQLRQRQAVVSAIDAAWEKERAAVEEAVEAKSMIDLPAAAEQALARALAPDELDESDLAATPTEELESELDELERKLPTLRGKPWYAVQGRIGKIVKQLAARDDCHDQGIYRARFLVEDLHAEWKELHRQLDPGNRKLDYPIFFATQRLESKDTSGDKLIAQKPDGSLARDQHGHWVIRHDFFSVELDDGTSTPVGIAEAFAEFAKKEKLSFF